MDLTELELKLGCLPAGLCMWQDEPLGYALPTSFYMTVHLEFASSFAALVIY